MEVSLDLAKIGVEIIGEIKDASDRVIVKPGTKLTPLLLKRLASWGVEYIEVAGEEATDSKDVDTTSDRDGKEEKHESNNLDKELVLRIVKKFSKVREDPLMDKIMRLAIKNLSNKKIEIKRK